MSIFGLARIHPQHRQGHTRRIRGSGPTYIFSTLRLPEYSSSLTRQYSLTVLSMPLQADQKSNQEYYFQVHRLTCQSKIVQSINRKFLRSSRLVLLFLTAQPLYPSLNKSDKEHLNGQT